MSFTRPADVEGRTVVTRDGEKIGRVDTVFLDVRTNQPEWAAVSTGMFGKHVSLLPLSAAAVLADGNLQVPFDKAKVKGAPHHDPSVDLKTSDEAELFRYYGVSYGAGDAETGADDTETRTKGSGWAATGSGDSTAGSPPAFETGGEPSTYETHDGPLSPETSLDRGDRARRSDTGERPVAGVATRSGTRLVKYIVTEQVTMTVPVSHEEVRVERAPSSEAELGSRGTPVGDDVHGGDEHGDDHEVVLHAERPIVHMETVPVERVRLDAETISGNETAGGEVHKEQIDLSDADADERTRR